MEFGPTVLPRGPSSADPSDLPGEEPQSAHAAPQRR